MVEHYEKQISKVVDHQDQSEKISIFGATLQDRANRIIKILNSYDARNRDGDRYVRTLFDSALIFISINLLLIGYQKRLKRFLFGHIAVVLVNIRCNWQR